MLRAAAAQIFDRTRWETRSGMKVSVKVFFGERRAANAESGGLSLALAEAA